MLSPNLAQYCDHIAEEIKSENPELQVDTFTLKSMVLGKLRSHASDYADLLIQTAQLTQIVKDLAVLARLQP